MPMDRTKYPDNWDDLAFAIKDAAGWKCEACGKQCYRPGEKHKDTRKTATVAHIVPVEFGGNDPNNLLCACSVCHLKYDNERRKWQRLAKKRIERQKKEPLFTETEEIK